MKKFSTLIIMLAMAFAARAQWDMYAFYRTYGDRYMVFTNKMMPTSDNCVIFDSELYINDGVCTESNYIGSVLYKADCGGDVLDSLFIPAPMFVANCSSACFRHPTVANATVFTSISNVNDSLFFRILTVSDDLDIDSEGFHCDRGSMKVYKVVSLTVKAYDDNRDAHYYITHRYTGEYGLQDYMLASAIQQYDL